MGIRPLISVMTVSINALHSPNKRQILSYWVSSKILAYAACNRQTVKQKTRRKGIRLANIYQAHKTNTEKAETCHS